MHAIEDAIASLEKANAGLAPELLSADAARSLLVLYSRAEKLAAFGKTAVAQKVDDAVELARVTGTSVGKARATVETANALRDCDVVSTAFGGGDISFEQAAEIARAEKAKPGSGSDLLSIAKSESFHVLRDEARKVVLEADRHRGLAERQREARSARSYTDPLGMVNVYMRLEPHVATPIISRAEAEAARMYRAVKDEGKQEPFERHLCDAFVKMLSGSSVKGNAKRPELVVLVSHEIARRGWKDVRDGEVCKIPGVGPVAPEVARRVAEDAFLTGLVYDGEDLRNVRRWTRNIPVEVRLALELGKPPDFDGVRCTDCGNRFRNEHDHDEPHVLRGPASVDNLSWRCRSCHRQKTERDRKDGKLKPRTRELPARCGRHHVTVKRGPPEA
jgi:hypothetical protein